MDYTLFEFIHQFQGRSKVSDAIALFIAEPLTKITIGICALLILWFAFRRSKNAWIIFFALVSGVLGKLIEVAFNYGPFFPRPFVVLGFRPLFYVDPKDSSFPSGHAAFLFGIAFFLLFAKKQWARISGIVLLIGATLVGVARIYAGVHWPLDILGGAFTGLFCAGVIHLIAKRKV